MVNGRLSAVLRPRCLRAAHDFAHMDAPTLSWLEIVPRLENFSLFPLIFNKISIEIFSRLDTYSLYKFCRIDKMFKLESCNIDHINTNTIRFLICIQMYSHNF